MKALILGGARSGKSALAERLAAQSGLSVCYIATATAGDEEMAARINLHQSRRPDHWALVESPYDLASTLVAESAQDRCLIVDCLGLWLSNELERDEGTRYSAARTVLLDTIPALPGHIIFVSNETGMGVVPMGVLPRRFVDEAGWLHQAVAAICDRVILTVAGLPYALKGELP